MSNVIDFKLKLEERKLQNEADVAEMIQERREEILRVCDALKKGLKEKPTVVQEFHTLALCVPLAHLKTAESSDAVHKQLVFFQWSGSVNTHTFYSTVRNHTQLNRLGEPVAQLKLEVGSSLRAVKEPLEEDVGEHLYKFFVKQVEESSAWLPLGPLLSMVSNAVWMGWRWVGLTQHRLSNQDEYYFIKGTDQITLTIYKGTLQQDADYLATKTKEGKVSLPLDHE